MSEENKSRGVEYRRFFHLSLCHADLMAYYQVNFQLMHHNKYSLTEIENMLPWEREIYMALITSYLEEENERIKQRNAKGM